MDNQDEVQKPLSQILYRQSSVETRLSPIHLSDEELPNADEKDSDNPKIIGYMRKSVEKIEGDTKIEKPPVSAKPAILKIKPKNLNTKDKPTPPLKNIKLNEKTQEMKIHNKDNGKDSKNDQQMLKDQFNDKLNKHLQDVTRKKGPPPPTRVGSVLINKGETLPEMLENKSTKEENTLENIEIKLQNQESVEFSVGVLKALRQEKLHTDKDRDNSVGETFQKEDMATLRPKSPRPVPLKGEKEETIWDKLGTLGRKKRIKEVQEVQAEGKYAIDSPGCPTAPIIPPEDYNLEDNEERCMIDPKAYDDLKFMDLLNVLKEWINDELASQRIIVQDLSEDLYDGQVLQKLLEKLTGDKLDVPEVTQSEDGQKQKLTVVLDHFNKVLGIQRQSHNKWNVESIHSKNIVAITHLLVALARHFRPPVRLPEHVSVGVVVVQKANGKLFHKTVRESLTKAYDDVGMRCERDAFDTLFDHAPDKLQVVKKSLVTFVNKHLSKMNFEVTEIESQFHDGVYLIMLMGLLEGFFVPHYSFHLTPHEFDQKVHNVNFAFELMEETGLQKPKARPEDVVNMDLKSTLRVLYNLFLQYRSK